MCYLFTGYFSAYVASSLLLPITVFFGFCCAEYTIDSDADFDPSFDLRLHNTDELLFKSSKLIHEDRE